VISKLVPAELKGADGGNDWRGRGALAGSLGGSTPGTPLAAFGGRRVRVTLTWHADNDSGDANPPGDDDRVFNRGLELALSSRGRNMLLSDEFAVDVSDFVPIAIGG
jgi:hypothetical protein